MIHFKHYGHRKFKVIKTLRELAPGLGLRYAKVLSESGPTDFPADLFPPNLDEATIVRRLREAGAEIEIRTPCIDFADPELRAMETVRTAMADFDEATRNRIAQWVYDRFFVDQSAC